MQVKSDQDGSDRTCPKCQTRVSVTPRITGRVGIMQAGVTRAHTNQRTDNRLAANVAQVIGSRPDRSLTEV